MSDADRAAAAARFRDEFGCGARDAGLAARAQFPFDDDVLPSDGFESDVARRSSHFSNDIRGLRGNEVGVAARRTIEEYLDLARDHRAAYYVDLFENLIDDTSGPVASPEPGE